MDYNGHTVHMYYRAILCNWPITLLIEILYHINSILTGTSILVY